jgi:putative addiction module killer protein
LKLEAYETSDGKVPFTKWFDGLNAALRRAVQRRLRAIEENDHFGQRRSLRAGLSELKFRQAIRIYFSEIDGRIVLLLGGSGKRDQNREIARVRGRLKDYRERQK